jgi:hypothetical protein
MNCLQWSGGSSQGCHLSVVGISSLGYPDSLYASSRRHLYPYGDYLRTSQILSVSAVEIVSVDRGNNPLLTRLPFRLQKYNILQWCFGVNGR